MCRYKEICPAYDSRSEIRKEEHCIPLLLEAYHMEIGGVPMKIKPLLTGCLAVLFCVMLIGMVAFVAGYFLGF